MADRQSTTSKLAIAAIICAILGWVLVVPLIPAIVMGHLALSKIKKNPLLKGRAIAITSLVICYAWLAILIVSVLVKLVTAHR